MNFSFNKAEASAHDRLPVSALLALAMTGFICIVTETLPAGLMTQISADFAISQALTGQWVTVYALGSLLSAIPLTIATRGWRRRSVLLLSITGFMFFNSVTAFSDSYMLTLIARFSAGVAAGLAWSLLTGYARRMVPPRLQGRALAIALVGTPLALSLGVPLGTFMGTLTGWRTVFIIMSCLAVVLIIWVLAHVPDYPGQPAHERMPLRKVLTTPGVRPVLSVIVAWMLAHNILYTYIAPFVQSAGLGERIDLVLLAFGTAALAGIFFTGKLVDRHLRTTVIVSLAGFALTAIVFGFSAHNPVVVYSGVVIWGMTFGGAATLLQTALSDSAGNGANVAQSMSVVAWNTAIAGGGVTGGVLLDVFGVNSLPWVLFILIAIALIITWFCHSHAFPRGMRISETSTTK